MRVLFGFFLAGLVFFTDSARGAKPGNLHGYLAARNNYVFPGSIRLGWKDWEGGMINSALYGLDKRFFITDNYFSEFGFGAVGTTTTFAFGFYGGLGFDTRLFWILGLRGELLGVAAHTGYMTCVGNLGLSIDF